MTNLLIAPARQSGCQDLDTFTSVVQAAAEQQRSPIDDILDSGVVDEESYLSALAQQSGMEWVQSIDEFDDIEATLKKRVTDLEIAKVNLEKELEKWEFLSKELLKSDLPPGVLYRICLS